MRYFKVVDDEEIDLTPEEIAEFQSYVPPTYGPRLPNLEPDQFWFVVRATGNEQGLRDWLAALNTPGTEEEPNPLYDPMAWAVASAKLDFAKHFERDHPLVEAASQALGLSPAQLDDLWTFAST